MADLKDLSTQSKLKRSTETSKNKLKKITHVVQYPSDGMARFIFLCLVEKTGHTSEVKKYTKILPEGCHLTENTVKQSSIFKREPPFIKSGLSIF